MRFFFFKMCHFCRSKLDRKRLLKQNMNIHTQIWKTLGWPNFIRQFLNFRLSPSVSPLLDRFQPPPLSLYFSVTGGWWAGMIVMFRTDRYDTFTCLSVCLPLECHSERGSTAKRCPPGWRRPPLFLQRVSWTPDANWTPGSVVTTGMLSSDCQPCMAH